MDAHEHSGNNVFGHYVGGDKKIQMLKKYRNIKQSMSVGKLRQYFGYKNYTDTWYDCHLSSVCLSVCNACN